MGRKRNGLLKLTFRKREYWTGHGQEGTEDYYRLKDCREYPLRHHLNPGEIKTIPVKPITIEDLGLIRLPTGRIIPHQSHENMTK